MKKILLLCLSLVILAGCQQGETTATDATMPKQLIENPYATKKILVLSKLNTYKALLLERLTKRLSKTYSFTIDDLNTIYDYNFTNYKAVLLIETPQDNKLNTLDNYFKDFAGVNNIIILAVADKPYTPSVNFECLVVSPNTNTENIIETAELIINHIRVIR